MLRGGNIEFSMAVAPASAIGLGWSLNHASRDTSLRTSLSNFARCSGVSNDTKQLIEIPRTRMPAPVTSVRLTNGSECMGAPFVGELSVEPQLCHGRGLPPFMRFAHFRAASFASSA